LVKRFNAPRLPIGEHADLTVLVGSPDFDASVGEAVEDLGVGVMEEVREAYGDYRPARVDGVQEGFGGGGFASVVSDF
jgi:hypothetical protein